MLDIPRFQPLDDDEVPFVSDEFEAGYQARLAGEEMYFSATRSWRAGWADADASITSEHTAA